MNSYPIENEFSIQSLAVLVKRYFLFVLKKGWWLWLTLAIAFGAYKAWELKNTPTNFQANMTFMINSGSGDSGMGSLLGLAGQFGLPGGSTSDVETQKIIELLQSRKIIQRVLFEKTEINGVEDYFANHHIDIFDWRENWEEAENLIDFRYTHGDTDDLTRTEASVMKMIHNNVVYGCLLIEERLTGITKLSFVAPNEKYSLDFLSRLYYHLSNYYVEVAVEQESKTYEMIKHRTDSLGQVVSYLENRIASSVDTKRGRFTAKSLIEETRLKRDLAIASGMLGTSSASLEAARFSLQDKKPFIEILDPPIYPLKAINPELLKESVIFAILGGLIGAILAGLFLLYKDFSNSIKKYEEEQSARAERAT